MSIAPSAAAPAVLAPAPAPAARDMMTLTITGTEHLEVHLPQAENPMWWSSTVHGARIGGASYGRCDVQINWISGHVTVLDDKGAVRETLAMLIAAPGVPHRFWPLYDVARSEFIFYNGVRGELMPALRDGLIWFSPRREEAARAPMPYEVWYQRVAEKNAIPSCRLSKNSMAELRDISFVTPTGQSHVFDAAYIDMATSTVYAESSDTLLVGRVVIADAILTTLPRLPGALGRASAPAPAPAPVPVPESVFIPSDEVQDEQAASAEPAHPLPPPPARPVISLLADDEDDEKEAPARSVPAQDESKEEKKEARRAPSLPGSGGRAAARRAREVISRIPDAPADEAPNRNDRAWHNEADDSDTSDDFHARASASRRASKRARREQREQREAEEELAAEVERAIDAADE